MLQRQRMVSFPRKSLAEARREIATVLVLVLAFKLPNKSAARRSAVSESRDEWVFLPCARFLGDMFPSSGARFSVRRGSRLPSGIFLGFLLKRNLISAHEPSEDHPFDSSTWSFLRAVAFLIFPLCSRRDQIHLIANPVLPLHLIAGLSFPDRTRLQTGSPTGFPALWPFDPLALPFSLT